MIIFSYRSFSVGWYSVVGIATRSCLDSPEIESQWVKFSALVQPWGSPILLHNGTGPFPGVKRPGRDVDHPPPSSVQVKERVELYLFFPWGSSWPVLGWTVPLTEALLPSDNAHHSSLRPFRLTAGTATFDTIPVSTYFRSPYRS